MSDRLHRQFIDLDEVSFTPALLACIPASAAMKFQVMPVHRSGNSVAVAFPAEEENLDAVDAVYAAIRRVHSDLKEMAIMCANAEQLGRYVAGHYGGPGSDSDLTNRVSE